ncbi:MAG: hypothetical protein FP825_12470 [Hyphomonas sp.]|uniref:hypothetical protein n=1 Tax=Hyphomonas sp. TaxID=87 RepID=UPI0017E68964|nr:hypothetical protein [Hyphomonas sp.]MBA3069276.1 hypothetical protein [Hyphomonas sp.]MBU3921312.1 hypothetical protein [Alphaproteobacteria bacterium]MBU4061776.1 hypothetical protein [Alphaproteobacteria bacterium]MBU4163392.1 hypothetical protein [Alphaproteobacteria bacterium]
MQQEHALPLRTLDLRKLHVGGFTVSQIGSASAMICFWPKLNDLKRRSEIADDIHPLLEAEHQVDHRTAGFADITALYLLPAKA